MNIESIVHDIINGKLTRETDEKGEGGFWDFAGELLESTEFMIEQSDYNKLQQSIYEALWEVFELTNKK